MLYVAARSVGAFANIFPPIPPLVTALKLALKVPSGFHPEVRKVSKRHEALRD